MNDVDLNKGMRWIKYLLFLFNLLFVITGVLIISVGLTIQYIYFDYQSFLEASFLSPAILLVVIGVIIFIVAFFGCCGAIRESTCMIMVFAVLMGLIFVLELSAAITGLVMQDGVINGIRENINYTMNRYDSDPAIADTVDFMQETLSCCGIDEPKDWAGKLTPSNETITVLGTYYVPKSCCAVYYDDSDITSNVTGDDVCKYIYGNGCLNRLEYVVSRSAVTLTSAAICLALLQILGVLFACSLGKTIRLQKTERERRRWELREKLINSYNPDVKPTAVPVVYLTPSGTQEC